MNSKIIGGKVNYSISAVRLFSLILIVTCHMMQFYGMGLAWWFNVGVQIFLCISGYLYGQRKSSDVISFYKHRFLKLLIPYYVVLFSAGMLLYIFFRDRFSLTDFMGALFCRYTIDGGGHLWFVATILMCYVLTPLLHIYRDRYVHNGVSLCLFTIIGSVIAVVAYKFYWDFNCAWICCYIIGYALGVNTCKKYISKTLLAVIFAFVAFIGNGIQIYINIIRGIRFEGELATAYGYFCDYNHVYLGIFLFLAIQLWLDGFNFEQHSRLVKALNFADQYSYECYLTHHFLILGPFSLMSVTRVSWVNVVIAICGIAGLTWVLKRCCLLGELWVQRVVRRNFC